MSRETLTVASDFIPVDLLLWRRFGSEASGRVEAVFALNMPIALQDEYLAVGTPVLVDVPDAVAPTPLVRVVRLWG